MQGNPAEKNAFKLAFQNVSYLSDRVEKLT